MDLSRKENGYSTSVRQLILCYQCLFEDSHTHARMHGRTHKHSKNIMPSAITLVEA